MATKKIDPCTEVQDVVGAIAGIEEVLAVGLPDVSGQKLVVYYTGLELVDWEECLKDQLVSYKLPKESVKSRSFAFGRERGSFQALHKGSLRLLFHSIAANLCPMNKADILGYSRGHRRPSRTEGGQPF